MDQIGSSVQDVEIREGAPETGKVLAKLHDMDANRIASTDAAVMHKAVLALLSLVSELERRVNALEAAAAPDGELHAATAGDNAL